MKDDLKLYTLNQFIRGEDFEFNASVLGFQAKMEIRSVRFHSVVATIGWPCPSFSQSVCVCVFVSV